MIFGSREAIGRTIGQGSGEKSENGARGFRGKAPRKKDRSSLGAQRTRGLLIKLENIEERIATQSNNGRSKEVRG